MVSKSKFLKILTSVLMLLLFYLLLTPSSYASFNNEQTNFAMNFVLTDSYFSSYLSQYDNCWMTYSSVPSSGNYDYYDLIFFNGDSISFTNSTYSNLLNVVNNNDYVVLNLLRVRKWSTFTANTSSITTGNSYVTLYSYMNSTNDTRPHFFSNDYYYSRNVKGDFDIYINDTLMGSYVTDIPYDMSFVITDKSTNTEHNFDFVFVEGSFGDGRSFEADDLVNGHYIVSIRSLNHNVYDVGDNNKEETWFVTGILDYVDYSDTTDSKTQFYWSSGYEIPKILNESSNPLTFYRFYFRGYSSDSFDYEELENDYNRIYVAPNGYADSTKYEYPSDATFVYSNRDVYWGCDTSMYGFNGLASTKFFDESEYGGEYFADFKNTEYISSSDYVSNQVESFYDSDDIYDYPSTSVVIGQNFIRDYNGTHIDEIKPYSVIQDLSGTSNPQAVEDMTENWGVLDYIKHIPTILSNIPKMIGDYFAYLFTPNIADLEPLIKDMDDFMSRHFGSIYDAIHFIYDMLKVVLEKYNSSYSYYPFTIPRYSLVQSYYWK